MTPVELTHFIRGKISVIPTIVEGRREWIDTARPLGRTLPTCFFNEPPHEVEALHVESSTKFAQAKVKEGVGDAARFSSMA